MMHQPSVSIIIPVYNSEATVATCLESATGQTLKNIEIICIDDHSTDSSADIISSISLADKRVKLIQHDTNLGEGAARNSGIDNARGHYVFHLDSDDTIPLDALEILFNTAMLHNSDMVKGRYAEVGDNDQIKHLRWSTPEYDTINTNIHDSEFLQQIPTSHCSYLYKREFLNRFNIRYPTHIRVGLDLIALTDALIHAKAVTIIPHTVYYYHQTDDSIIRGSITLATALDAIYSKFIVADMLKSVGLEKAAYKRLQIWTFIIDNFWRKMPESLTHDECIKVFDCFRQSISLYNIAPWLAETPHQYRYLLALVLARKDEEALSFLDMNAAFDGTLEYAVIKSNLHFVLSLYPNDVGALMELGSIARQEGELENALKLFQRVIQIDSNFNEARLQAAGLLLQLGQHDAARETIDSLLDLLTSNTCYAKEIKRAATLKEFLGQERIKEKIKARLKAAHRIEMKATREEMMQLNRELHKILNELKEVYSSKSWRITAPLRKAVTFIKNKQ